MKDDVFTVAEALKNAQKSRKSTCNNFFQMVKNQKNGHPPNYAPQNIRGHELFYYLKHEFLKVYASKFNLHNNTEYIYILFSRSNSNLIMKWAEKNKDP